MGLAKGMSVAVTLNNAALVPDRSCTNSLWSSGASTWEFVACTYDHRYTHMLARFEWQMTHNMPVHTGWVHGVATTL